MYTVYSDPTLWYLVAMTNDIDATTGLPALPDEQVWVVKATRQGYVIAIIEPYTIKPKRWKKPVEVERLIASVFLETHEKKTIQSLADLTFASIRAGARQIMDNQGNTATRQMLARQHKALVGRYPPNKLPGGKS